MDMKSKHNLASAYMAAWHAVKGTHDRVVVNPEPHGWFEIINTCGPTRISRRVRIAAIASGLFALTAQLERAAQ